MLTLTRKEGEGIRIGDDVRVVIREIRGRQIRVGIAAPASVGIYREEIYLTIQQANASAAGTDAEAVNQFTALLGAPSRRRRNSQRARSAGGKTMKVETTRFGEMDVPEDQILQFPGGLLGLPDLKQYFLVEHAEGSPLRWLQSAEAPEVAFVVTDPRLFVQDYVAAVKTEELSPLPTEDPASIAVGVICTIPSDPKQATANLRAPVFIDARTRQGKQVVLEDSDYPIHHFWFRESASDTVTAGTAAENVVAA